MTSLECRAPRSRPRYSPRDYAEEWMFLTGAGVRSDQIIDRSRPSRDWFHDKVLPRVTRSICATCGEPFDPRKAESLLRCTPACGFVPARTPDLISY